MEKEVEKKKIDYSSQGKKNRAAGLRFEAKARAGLEKMDWIVDKWTNTVDYQREGNIGKVVPAKRKYNPFKKVMVIGTGFPDFIAFKINGKNSSEKDKEFPLMKGFCDKCKVKSIGHQISKNLINCDSCNEVINSVPVEEWEKPQDNRAEIVGVEVKKNGYLDKKERGMCSWLIQSKTFSRILIAKAVQNGRKIDVEYEDFEKKYKKEFNKEIKSVSTPTKVESDKLKKEFENKPFEKVSKPE